MRILFLLLAAIGASGIGLGVLALVRGTHGQAGALPFAYEYTGGPGSIIAGLLLLGVALYLRAVWPARS